MADESRDNDAKEWSARPRRVASCKARQSITDIYGARILREVGDALVGGVVDVVLPCGRATSARVVAYNKLERTHVLQHGGRVESVDLGRSVWRFRTHPAHVRPSGVNVVGLEIDIRWPLDRRFYTARVADFRRGRHLLCYVDGEGKVEVEEVDLGRTRREWRVTTTSSRNTGRSTHRLVGRHLLIDPVEGESAKEWVEKIACVLHVRDEPRLSKQLPTCSKFRYRPASHLPFVVIYISDQFLTDIVLAEHTYIEVPICALG